MPSSLRRDILSAYAASISRVLSWVIVSALVYRRSTEAFAMLALVRGTLGILNYCSLGLLPAMIRAFATIPSPPSTPGGEGQGEAGRTSPTRSTPSIASVPAAALPIPIPLAYVTPQTTRDEAIRYRPRADAPTQRTFSSGIELAALTFVIGVAASLATAHFAHRLFVIPAAAERQELEALIRFLGIGFALRWLSDPLSALLQSRGRITDDNVVVTIAEVLWVGGCCFALFADPSALLEGVGKSFFIAAAGLLLFRISLIHRTCPVRLFDPVDRRTFVTLLSTGLLITLAQLADYLYAPTDYILINRLLTPFDLAAYAPAIQIDAGLMILVTALASVLLPKAALAHAAGDRRLVRHYYLRGTLASAALLAASGLLVYLLSPWIFRIWLGNDMPATRAILPLVLTHTILGGSSAVGRSILLAVGKTRPFTISVLLAGVTNVAASYAFVRYLHLGLGGIVLGTIVAVVARCAIWMPWYVLRELRHPDPHGFDVTIPEPPAG